jgi:type VI protein secretion system component Hcp
VSDKIIQQENVMQLDQYVKFNGIKGTSTEKNHTDWIPLIYLTLSNSFFDDNPSSSLYFTKNIDTNSPLIMHYYQTRKTVPELIIDMVTSSEDTYQTYRYTFKHCQFVCFNISAHQQILDEYTWNPKTSLINGNNQEEIGINFKSVEITAFKSEEELSLQPLPKEKKGVTPGSPSSSRR